MDKTDIPGTFNAGATLGPVNETNMAGIWNKHKQSNTPLKRKVFVAMSGGVDSSVSALLLKNKGYNVTGIYMRCYNLDGCSERDAEDARRVAEKINIPFYIFDFESEYKKRVVEYMVEGYKSGITPNPDVMCNREIKFGLFLKKSLSLGADYIATGHYVKKIETGSRGEKTYHLHEAKDKNKDQSYFLWPLTQSELKYCLFPIGNLHKREVRAIAERAKLPTADKKDSQGICFLGDISMTDFLKTRLKEKKGKVIDTNGNYLGEHEGAYFYTIGQRHGLRLEEKNKNLKTKNLHNTPPHYVVSKNVNTNTIVAAEGDKNPALYEREVTLTEVNNISSDTFPPESPLFARVRYRQPLFPVKVKKVNRKNYKLSFLTPQRFIAPGQSTVVYGKKGELLLGGIIR